MEHLFLDVSPDVGDEKLKYALDNFRLKETDPQSKLALVPPVKPFTRWLGYDHDAGASLHDGDPHQPLPFWAYAQKRGWDLAPLFNAPYPDQGVPPDCHPSLRVPGMTCQVLCQRIAAFLQSWLYFGFLESFVCRPIHTSYLLRRDPATGHRYIHTGNLNFIIAAWLRVRLEAKARNYESIRKAGTRVADKALDEASKAINSVWRVTEVFERIPNSPLSELCQAIAHFLPSVIRLHDALLTARSYAILDSEYDQLDRYSLFSRYPPYEESRRRSLLRRGWCPFLIEQYNGVVQSVLDWLYGSGKRSPSSGHSRCTRFECVRNNIDRSTYEIEHRSQYCGCPFVKPDLDAVMTTIDNNKIPVMRVTRAGDEVKLGVVPYDPHSPEKTRFVAISHVWVDGLGSTSEKGLPSCQVIRLAKSIATLTEGGETLFWMDSLCIPGAESQRKKAIGTMRKVYQNAVAVLVIEKTIGNIPKDAKLIDKHWAILSSSWVQRLWTYQEGYLAAKVFMQVADEQLMEMRPPFDEVLGIMQRYARTAAFEYLLKGMVSVRPWDMGGPNRSRSEMDICLGFAADALSWRSTSRATDETVAIAALFDIDSDRLISVEGSEARMRAFFLMLGRTPWSIIFHGGPRLSAPGFRWAPASLLARSGEGFGKATGESDVLCTEDGLLGRYFVLCLSGDPRPLVRGLSALCHADGGGELAIGCLDDTNVTPVAQLFNAIIFRAVESEHKNPKQLPQQRFWWRQGVAVLLRDEVLGEDYRICNVIGNVIMATPESFGIKLELEGKVALLESKWMNLCIT